jgi:CheY-like chemotaxis protein
LVDDDAITCEIAGAMLRAQGHDVDVADSGCAAIERLQEVRYDAVLLDINLPDISGYDVADRLRRSEAGLGRTPILAFSASISDADHERLRAAGIEGCIGKPLNEAALAMAVTSAVSRTAASPAAPASNPDPPSPPPLVDDFAVRTLTAVVGAERTKQIQGQFWAEWPKHVTRLCSVRLKSAQLAEDAHRLTALAGNCGFLRLSLTCRDLMVAASSASAAEVTDELIGRVLAVGDETRDSRAA